LLHCLGKYALMKLESKDAFVSSKEGECPREVHTCRLSSLHANGFSPLSPVHSQ